MKYKLLIIGALGVVLTASCGHNGGAPHGGDGNAGEAKGHSGEIVVSPEDAKAAGIVTAVVTPGEFYGIIPAGGKILAAAGDEATVVATVAGIVSLPRGLAEGSAVSKGGTVFTISSRNLQDDPARQAAIAYQAAKKEYDRAAALVKDRIVTQKEFNALKAEYERAKAAYGAFGGSGGGAAGVAVKSPIGGYVKTCLVKAGDYVSVGQPMMTVTQARSLYLRVNVPERYYKELGSVVSAKFKTAYGNRVYDLRQMNGRLVATGKSTGDGSPYIPVTFRFDNRADVMPGAFVETYVLTGGRTGVITLPISALTDEQGVSFVYVQTDAECYERREVATGRSDGERVEITDGLKAGEKVVVDGAVQVRLAGASNTIPGHTHTH